MDISKASNLERFVFDLVGRDAVKLAELWNAVESGKGFKLDDATFAKMGEQYGFLSAKSSHADRLNVIREVHEKYGLFIDTHTADGYKSALLTREPGVKMVIMETALAAKFEETIQEALGILPNRPEHLIGIENLPQRSITIEADEIALKKIVIDNL